MGHRIFISYRRLDSIHESGRIYDRLVGALGEDVVFRDVDAIPLGVDFRKVLDDEVSISNILLAIIGDGWLDVQDEHGNRRLDNPNDFVRIEIESAIKRKIHVIPVFVGRISGLPTDRLPETMHELAFFNGTPVRPDPDFHKDVDKLIRAVGHIFDELDARRESNAAALQALAAELSAFTERISALAGLNAAEKGQRTKLQKRLKTQQSSVATLLADEPGLGRELDMPAFREAIEAFDEDLLELEAKTEERQSAEKRERATEEEREADRKREAQAAADRLAEEKAAAAIQLAVEQAAAADRLAAEQAAVAKSEAEAKRQRAQRKEQNESSLHGLIDDTEALQKKLTTLTNLSDTENEEKTSIATRLETLLGEFNTLLGDEAGLGAELDTSDFQQRIDRLTQAVTTLQDERRERLRSEKEEAERSEREQREADRIRKSLTHQREDMQKMLELLNGGIGLDDLAVTFQEDGANLVDQVQGLITQLDDALQALPPRVDDATTIEDYQQSLTALREEVQSWHKEVRAAQPRNWTWTYVVGGIAAVALLAWGASQIDFSGSEPEATMVVIVEPSVTVSPDVASVLTEEPGAIADPTTAAVLTEVAVGEAAKPKWEEVARFNERGIIQEMQLSPDESMLAVASSTGFWLYEYPAMTLRASYETGAALSSMAWSPDGSRVVLGGNENQVYIWDVEIQQEIYVFKAHASEVTSVDWSPDGSLIASGDDYGMLYIWSPDSGQIKETLQGHDDRIWDVEFSSDPDLLASASADNTVHVWDLTSGEYITVFDQHIYPAYALAWSPDGKRIASADSNVDQERNSSIYIWYAETGDLDVAMKHIHAWGIYDLHWSADGTQLASAGWDWNVGIWDVGTGEELGRYYHDGSVYTIDWSSPENGWLLTATQSGDINYIDLDLNAPFPLLSEHASTLNGFAISPDEQQYLLIRQDSVLPVIEVATGELSFDLIGHTSNVWDAAWSSNNAMIATAGGWNDYTVRIWDAADGSEVAVLNGHLAELTALSWSPDNTKIVSGSSDATVRIWDVDAAQEIVSFDVVQEGNVVHSVAWSPDGQWVASGSDGLLNIWNADTLSLEMTLEGHSGGVLALAWSPDGKYLASGGEQSEVYIWNIASGGKRVSELDGGGDWGYAYALAWSPDGNYLAISGGASDIFIWDTSPWREIAALSGHTFGVFDLFWAADSTLLFSGSWDGTVRIWQLTE